jgi:hypothetical protein
MLLATASTVLIITEAVTTTDPGLLGLHGTAAIAVTVGLASVTLVAIVRAGVVPLFRAIARMVEAMEVILGTDKQEGIASRLDKAEVERKTQTANLDEIKVNQDEIKTTIKKAGILNGTGDQMAKDIQDMKSTVKDLSHDLRRHVTDEAARNAAIWAAIAEVEPKDEADPKDEPEPKNTD